MKRINPNIKPVEKSNDFVGIKVNKNQIDIYVPQMFRTHKLDDGLYDKETYKDLLLFLKSINIAKKINHEKISGSSGESEQWPIESYLWIIQDYIENGYYYNREKIYSNDRSGKIDWKRTLKSVPIYSDGNIIYDKIVTSRMSASNDVIAQIYKICLKQSVNRIGWAFNYNIFVEVQQLKSIKEMIHIVNKELVSTFDDIKRLRFRHMLSILQSLSDENALSDKTTYGIENYYCVFETMVDSLFHGIDGKEKKKYNPSGYWILNNQDEFESSNLRPDTIYKNIKSNETFIIDAKMYQYGYTKKIDDLPKTSSMQKQITYGDFVHHYVDPKSNIRNAFVLPFNKELFDGDTNVQFNDDGNLAYIGTARVNYRNDRDAQPYDTIYAFMVDFNFLLRNYKTRDTKYIETLCETINKKLVNAIDK